MLLAIDSATAACSAALIDGAALVDERFELVGRGHAERLLPMIEELLGGRRPSGILVDCGPGSFTGVRVGLAAAHGLAIGWGVPLLGYSSMAAIAATADAERLAVALHGGHGQLFVQSFTNAPLQPVADLQSLLPDDAARAFDEAVVIGSGAEALVAARGHGEARNALPRAADARLLPEALRSLPPRPLYGRAPDAKPLPQ
ncbi:tRNA (adenosine(37)-N6)-threonylcarbamoyltransferase complex dimerization subunit type 1 TsaB [Sphingosinicella sp. BN140058]|uniref:tRNA (adenosine(37)-N6)-threonylcarbamoyltransferase complex dimerization subunit type 1 TsaB n=1 Tax=Sphingosinicella sp. BN140058 TaxID=1892855 RepID=UPI0010103DB0|nr:tRNA (adenosine(37)-N6)-threonylcarbamoyltransferase complex dimerization subunit type 1 TsaB [Sphingosinicella sp. BN140058]QAY76094.1 tRNA (adenosine(37)-N6)-threonylcarbamoyltransferase complex dimerization subunit type 1 TsaB [Sphingosinicella sp. BN140058]